MTIFCFYLIPLYSIFIRDALLTCVFDKISRCHVNPDFTISKKFLKHLSADHDHFTHESYQRGPYMQQNVLVANRSYMQYTLWNDHQHVNFARQQETPSVECALNEVLDPYLVIAFLMT